MYAILAVSLIIVAVLDGVTALKAQYPLGPYQLNVLGDDTFVPLHPRAGKGLLPPHLEEGAILSLGPRFMNVIYKNSTDDELGSCWSCIPTIAKETPCVYQAIKEKSFKPLLTCGVTKADLCQCADCLPSMLKKFVEPFCQDKGDEPNKPSLKNPPRPAERVADADINFQAFKGSLLKSTADDLKAVDFCPGSSCGGCNCCVGGCVFG
ncbi:hypothetical protein V8F06_008983, partial [Rhypophila decipiens]